MGSGTAAPVIGVTGYIMKLLWLCKLTVEFAALPINSNAMKQGNLIQEWEL